MKCMSLKPYIYAIAKVVGWLYDRDSLVQDIPIQFAHIVEQEAPARWHTQEWVQPDLHLQIIHHSLWCWIKFSSSFIFLPTQFSYSCHSRGIVALGGRQVKNVVLLLYWLVVRTWDWSFHGQISLLLILCKHRICIHLCADYGVVSHTSKSLRGRLISGIFCYGGYGTVSVRVLPARRSL